MTVRLRPHHLLCLLTYVGKGYSPGFTANYDAVAARIGNEEDIVIVEGPDDVCRPLLDDEEPHCWQESVSERDRWAARDLSDLLAQPIGTDASITLDAKTLAGMRTAFSAGSIRAACVRCEWNGLCNAVAAHDYQGAVLSPPETHEAPKVVAQSC